MRWDYSSDLLTSRKPIQNSFQVYSFNQYLFGTSLVLTILIMLGLYLYSIKEKRVNDTVSSKKFHLFLKSTGIFRNLSVDKTVSSTSLVK